MSEHSRPPPSSLRSRPPASARTLPPEQSLPKEQQEVMDWALILDEVDYLTLLRLPRPVVRPNPPGSAEAASGTPETPVLDERHVRAAFHAFALAFHPDRHREASEPVREAARRVFARGAEAYRVLLDPWMRQRFLKLHEEEGAKRLPPDEQIVSGKPIEKPPESLVELTKSPFAKPFAQRADELMLAGDLKQARLQLQLALMKEGKNAPLEAQLRLLDDKIKGKTGT